MQQAHSQPIVGATKGEATRQRRLLPAPTGVPQRRLLGALAPSAILALAVLLAFPVSALSLWKGMQTDSPLAYMGLIPLLAFLTAVAHAWRRPTYVWRDSVTELVVAAPFLLAALGLMYAGTRLGSIYFWYNRSDLLALALFGIGAAIVLFGVGAVTRSWFAVLYLILLWPGPYQSHLSTLIIHITDATVAALDAWLRGVNWSGAVAAGDAVYRVSGPGGVEQYVGVDSPCAGAAGMFGFLIVAIPALYLTTGRWARKLGWLALGLALLWAFNVGRIFVLLWVASSRGVESGLFWWTHASLGMLLFTLAISLMLYLGYRFGFRFERSNEIATAPSMLRIRRQGATPLLVLATLVLALGLGALNRDMIDAVGLSTRLADGTTITPFAAALPAYQGVEPRYIDEYAWASQFFGRDSTYQRYAYNAGDGGVIWVDTVVTDERERLDLFNLQGCYNFHGYEMSAVSTVEVGYGIVAQQIQFVMPDSGARWIALSWTWPVNQGGQEVHERVTLLQHVAAGDANATVTRQDDTLSALERLFGIGNGRVAVGPEAEEVLAAGNAIIRGQLENGRAGQ